MVLFATPLWYANAGHFRTEMTAAIDRAGHPIRLVVLDTIGMTDLDYTGSHALRQMLDRLDRSGVSFAMARTSETAWREAACSGGSARTTYSPPSAKQSRLYTPISPRGCHDGDHSSAPLLIPRFDHHAVADDDCNVAVSDHEVAGQGRIRHEGRAQSGLLCLRKVLAALAFARSLVYLLLL